MTEKMIEELEHTADLAIRVRGGDLAELFVNAARGMFGLMLSKEQVEPSVEREIELQAYDVETLLVDWLGELLYLNETHGEAYVDYQIQTISSTQLKGIVRGGPAKGQAEHIKAVTFNELEIERSERGFETSIVFDV